MMQREDVLKHLKEEIIQLVYRKSDGSVREALATTNPNVIYSKGAVPYGKGKAKATEDVITYFDMAKKAWRSFRFDRLISVTLPDD